ncbi:nuclear transport factor 2 family protein [Aquabacterium humicola]|uniref:nuclear transport factor 2 family protein n=1 Tax=Aquabacterium humicola TaxID=3237377 RepID=UPI002542B91C|nr:nuclear transport factor 2 family protein [Rubrivivax pictus]
MTTLLHRLAARTLAPALMFSLLSPPTAMAASADADRAAVAAIDTAYQAAVKRNDHAAMALILADDMVLIGSAGQVVGREQLLAEARKGSVVYEQQDELPGTQTVRVWGDTAVVTALLWVKCTYAGKPIDRKLWFSDTYVRVRGQWRYVLGQVGATVEKDGVALP